MKKLLILSGKGGTGKTTTAAAFIRFANARAFADCDVDAPNLHIVTKEMGKAETSAYYGSEKAWINKEVCIGCGRCMEHCKFGAIRKENGYCTIDEYACEGCGVCCYVCPQKAVEMREDVAGEQTLYQTDRIFSTAKLKMGRGNSGKLVSAVKLAMMRAGKEMNLAIIDGSPGIGCPVIASMSGVDLVLIVAEPSLSGLSDLKRLLKTAAGFQTKAAVCVNKFDISLEQTEEIKSFCLEQGVPFVGCIPYDTEASKAINEGKSLADVACPARDALRSVFDQTMQLLGEPL